MLEFPANTLAGPWPECALGAIELTGFDVKGVATEAVQYYFWCTNSDSGALGASSNEALHGG